MQFKEGNFYAIDWDDGDRWIANVIMYTMDDGTEEFCIRTCFSTSPTKPSVWEVDEFTEAHWRVSEFNTEDGPGEPGEAWLRECNQEECDFLSGKGIYQPCNLQTAAHYKMY